MSPHNEKLVRDIVAVAKVNAAMNIPLVLVLSLMQRRCSSADIGPKEQQAVQAFRITLLKSHMGAYSRTTAASCTDSPTTGVDARELDRLWAKARELSQLTSPARPQREDRKGTKTTQSNPNKKRQQTKENTNNRAGKK